LISSTLNIQINVGQNSSMNTSEVLMTMETLSTQSLSNKTIQQIGNAQIHLPSNFNLNNNRTVSLRVRFIFYSLLELMRIELFSQ
jgi:hypothetical protein